MRKFHHNRGETLVEVLVSILIAALSVTLLFSCVMVSSNIDVNAEGVDEKHYNALTEADAQVTLTPKTDSGESEESEGSEEDTSAPAPLPTGSVTVSRVNGSDTVVIPETTDTGEPDSDVFDPSPLDSAVLPVTIYGGEDMYSYKRDGS